MRSRRFLFPFLCAALALSLTGCAGGNLFNQIVNFWSLSACGTVLVILDIIILLELAGDSRSAGSKILWAAVVVIFPYLGALLYFLFGR